MWLLAHYKEHMDEKLERFSNHGRHDDRQLQHALDQASFQKVEATTADTALSERFPQLSLGQIAMCRGHLESIIISFVGWNDKALEHVRDDKTAEPNERHDNGFGEELWEECHESIPALFDAPTWEESKDAWKRPAIAGDDDNFFYR